VTDRIISLLFQVILTYLAFSYIRLWWPIRSGSRLLKRVDKKIERYLRIINEIERQSASLTGIEKEASIAFADFVRPQFQILFTVKLMLSSYFSARITCKMLPNATDPCFHQLVLSMHEFKRQYYSVYAGKNFRKCCQVLSFDDPERKVNIEELMLKSKNLNSLFRKHHTILGEYRNHIAAHIDGDSNRVWMLYKDDHKKRDFFLLASDVLIFCFDFVKTIDAVLDDLCNKDQPSSRRAKGRS